MNAFSWQLTPKPWVTKMHPTSRVYVYSFENLCFGPKLFDYLQVNSKNELGSVLMSPNLFKDDAVDGFICPENLPPLREIFIASKETLQVVLFLFNI